MTYKGHVHNGRVVLDTDISLPENVEVEVTLSRPFRETGASQDEFAPGGVSQERYCEALDLPPLPDLEESDLLPDSAIFGELIGSIEGCPADLAENHDHYLHGTPKR